MLEPEGDGWYLYRGTKPVPYKRPFIGHPSIGGLVIDGPNEPNVRGLIQLAQENY